MQMLKSVLVRLVREEDGAAAAEYAILVAFVAGAVAAAVHFFDLNGIFTSVSDKVTAWVDNAPNTQ